MVRRQAWPPGSRPAFHPHPCGGATTDHDHPPAPINTTTCINTTSTNPDNTPPDTANLSSTTQAAPANNAPALNDTDIARAGRNPAPTLASGFPLALNCYPYIYLIYMRLKCISYMYLIYILI
jgi:hypothetical protein